MLDYLLAFTILTVLAALPLAMWRRIGGPARTRLRLAGRVALSIAIAVVVTGVLTYRLTKSRSFQLAGELVQRVDTSEKVVALTFDDGPSDEHTADVLEALRARQAKATFYLIGSEAEAHPDQLKAIIAAGHELGNHTYTHRRLVFLPGATVADEFERTDAVFHAAGYNEPTTARPPGCKRLLTAPLYLAKSDRVTVIWDLEPDSLPEVADDPDRFADYVVSHVRPGSIVLLHAMYDEREATREALPKIVDQLSEKGYRFVTVSELLAMR